MANSYTTTWGIVGSATVVQGDADLSDVVQDAQAIVAFDGGPPPDGSADGETFTVTVTIIAGSAVEIVVVVGATIDLDVVLVEGAAEEVKAIDGGRIFEWAAQQMPSTIYSQSDYDSIYSIGDRGADGNGLISITKAGWGTTFGSEAELIDAAVAFPLGNGFSYGGSGGGPGPEGAYVAFEFHLHGLWIDGIKFIGADTISAVDVYALYPGAAPGFFWPFPHHAGVDGFVMGQTSAHPYIPGMHYSMLPFSMDTYIPWPIMGLFYSTDTPTAGRRLANEVQFSVIHSNLDGGNRRLDNGNPNKQVAITLSSDWQQRTSPSPNYGPIAENAVDGENYMPAASTSVYTWKASQIGKAPSDSTAMDTVGAYIQFVFPRVVYPFQMVFQLLIGEEVWDSGGEPTKMGKWHWEISNTGGASWVQVGGTWWFKEECVYALAPHNGLAFDFVPGTGGLGETGATHWRMVLDEGPAFGGGFAINQIMFDLYDITDTAAPLYVQFTDDEDGELPTATIVNESPYIVRLSDGDDDGLTFTLDVTPNLYLDIAFSDGVEDGLTAFGSFYPSNRGQIMIISTGRKS